MSTKQPPALEGHASKRDRSRHFGVARFQAPPPSTLEAPERLVRRLLAHSAEPPWRWTAAHVEELFGDLPAEHHAQQSTRAARSSRSGCRTRRTPTTSRSPGAAVRSQDAAALLGSLATLEGNCWPAPSAAPWRRRLGPRFPREVMMPADGGPPQLRLALENRIQRLHYSPGAYVQPPREDLDLA